MISATRTAERQGNRSPALTYHDGVAHQRLAAILTSGLSHRPRPLYAGAVLGLADATDNAILACGEANRYADAGGTLLPAAARTAMREDTVLDLASLTKVFTALLVLSLVSEGRLDLDQPVAEILPSYRGPVRDRVRVRHLLTHTAGLPAEGWYWRDQPNPDARRAAILTSPLVAPPGARFCYSCVGYLTLGLLVADVTGRDLARAGARPDLPSAGDGRDRLSTPGPRAGHPRSHRGHRGP